MINLIPKHTHYCTAPSSKSLTIRQLIIAALGDRQVRIFCPTVSFDVMCCVDCLKELGTRITYTDHTYTVTPINRDVLKEEAVLECGESAALLRFFMPVAAALGIKVTLHCSGNLISRPIEETVSLLKSKGIVVEETIDSYIVSGKLSDGEFRIDTSLSSQYASGFLMTLPILQKSKIIFEGSRVSNSYLNMTVAVLIAFGYKLEYTDNSVCLVEKIPSPAIYEFDGDWSSAAYLLSCGAVSESLTVKGINNDSIQGDRMIVDILKSFGAEVNCTENSVTVSPSSAGLHGISVECSDIPDLVPAIAALGACAEGVTEIKGCERLRTKESDRIKAIEDFCSSAGIKTEYSNGLLRIYGGFINSCEINTYSDHRIVMAAGILAYKGQGEISVDNISCTAKSYPEYIITLFK